MRFPFVRNKSHQIIEIRFAIVATVIGIEQFTLQKQEMKIR